MSSLTSLQYDNSGDEVTIEPFHPDLGRHEGANDVYLGMEWEGRTALVLQCSVWGAAC